MDSKNDQNQQLWNNNSAKGDKQRQFSFSFLGFLVTFFTFCDTEMIRDLHILSFKVLPIVLDALHPP